MSSRNFPLPPPPPSAHKEPHHGLPKPQEDTEWYQETDCVTDHYSQVGPSHFDKGYPCDPMDSELVKPNLPPKPPPAYREPPEDSVRRRSATASQPPDLCPRTSQNFSAAISSSTCTSAPVPLKPAPKPDKQDSIPIGKQGALGTQAWAQEPKPSGKLVGERLSSLQRKLRSLLTQTQPSVVKDTFPSKGLHSYRQEQNESQVPAPSGLNEHEPKPNVIQPPSLPQQNPPSGNDQRGSCLQASSTGFASGYSYGQEFGFPPMERHPFESTTNHEESEEVDTSHIRDTCNRLFSSNDPKGAWAAYRSPRSSYSNNIKSAYDYDKLVPKEVIGKPCQEKKPAEVYTHVHASYQSSNSYPNLVSNSDQHQELYKTEPKNPLYLETQYYSLKDVYNVPEVETSNENPSRKNRYYHRKLSSRNRDFSDTNTSSTKGDCGDVSDQYKSSSESGHGTMQSSTKDSKSLISAPSSGISAASNLDTSLDSDHSANCALWDNPQSRDWSQKSPSVSDKRQYNDNQGQQDYGTSEHAEKGNEESDNDGLKTAGDHHTYSESMSGTPPLPPLSPPPSSNLSESSSPRASPKAKYKLSLSTSALNSHQQASHSDNPPKVMECNSGKSKHRGGAVSPPNCKPQSSTKKNSARLVGSSSRHWKSGPSPHQRTNITGCNGGRKGRSSSPTLRQLSRLPPQPLALSSYNEFADLELTSTTTGLDGESVDDQDDLSSELSISTSTMDPMEVSMIRKQLEGLETMYSEILHLLGVKNSPCKAISRTGGNTAGFPRNSRCRMNGSLSSLTARSSNSRTTHNLIEKRVLSDKRRGKDGRNGSPSKRLQRLESHVVTLARSVAHLSSEMRTQHMLVQELEHMRRDVTWVHERLRLMQLTQGCHGAAGNMNVNKSISTPIHTNWEHFRKEVSELLNPNRAKKLTKFFGDEPPLIRQFLKRLGYEKWAPNFETEKIGIMELPYLTEERLHKIGIPMGPRMRILQEARAYCQQNQYKVYVI